jgi:ferric-dicitrate binding protein FerR (iron transport regulator)
MTPAPSKALLEKFFRSQCTEEEHRQVVSWLQTARPEEWQPLMEDHWEGFKKETVSGQFDDRQLFGRIQASVQAPARHRPTLARRMLRIAASLVGILLAAGLVWWLFGIPREVVYASGYGETRTVTLPDQSTVVLHGNSSIRFTGDWDQAQPRTVSLTGEAFFSVVHTISHQPFVVRTSENFNVEVLGTQFNVSNRRNGTKVVLNEGKIKLTIRDALQPHEPAENVIMRPGELVEFSGNPATYTRRVVNPDLYTAWKQNKLILQNTSLQEIVTILEDSYGLRVQVTDQRLLKLLGSGSIPTDDPEVLLSTIAEVFDLKMNMDGKSVTFLPKP